MMKNPVLYGGHSALVKMRLIVNGISFRIAQMGPDFLLIESPSAQSPARATIEFQVDDTRVAMLEEIRAKDGNLSIPLYVAPAANVASNANSTAASQPGLSAALDGWLESSFAVRQSLVKLFEK
jgi:hypothetical protein